MKHKLRPRPLTVKRHVASRRPLVWHQKTDQWADT